jgi:hypothetical protein
MLISSSIIYMYHRVGKGRGETARVSLLSQLESPVHYNFSGDGYFGNTTVARCPSMVFRHGNKNALSLELYY